MESMIPKDILEKALSGSEEAFEELVKASYSTVYRFACRYVGKQEDAEDITQETFLKIAAKIHTYKRDASFSTWVYRITINTAKDYIKKKGRMQTESYINGVHVKMHSGQSNPGSGKDIMGAVSKLPPKLKDAVVLVFAEDMNHSAAARVLGVAETTVSWRIYKAKKILRKVLS
jgi:RNA polymerase sigma factor (sigma-70 family)